jgi:TetR/AcrR family transcriptional regulator, transcriptional repressor of bet genes
VTGVNGVRATTPKGERAAESIIEATVRCLARDGYAATSVQRIADEAGVQKRMVHYYFASREQLFDAVVRRIGDALLEQIADAVRDLHEPPDIVAVGFDRFWTGVTSDRALLTAYFGLVAESVTDPRLRATIAYVADGYRELIERMASQARDRGRRLRMAEETLSVLIIAGINGLTLEWLTHGDTPQLEKAIAAFQHWLSSVTDG